MSDFTGGISDIEASEQLERIVSQVEGLWSTRCHECGMLEVSGKPFPERHVCDYCRRGAEAGE